MKQFLPILILGLSISIAPKAQEGIISGKVSDSLSGKALVLATVTVFRVSDSMVVTYRLTNTNGSFKVTGLPLQDTLKVLVSFSGYTVARKILTLHLPKESTDLGNIKLKPTLQSLDEVIVYSERPPVIFKKDTVEFNAAAFKTLPSSLLEDLLKKLPGIQFSRSGELLYAGKKINRLLVDGKAFFGDNYQMATQNLPANIIANVQIFDDGDELRRNNDGDTMRIGKVINVLFKKGVKKGWFGKVYAGIGTKERYEVGGIANIYRDTLQLSILGFSNNINRSGFNMKDLRELGGFSRSGFQSTMSTSTSNREGMELNGISFGGTEDGLIRTNVGGINLNHAPSKKLSLFTQALLGNAKKVLYQVTNRKIANLDTVLINTNNDTVNSQNQILNLNIGLTWKPDNNTEVLLNGGYRTRSNAKLTNTSVITTDNKSGTLNVGESDFTENADMWNYQHYFSVSKRLKSKLRKSFFISHSYTVSDNPVVSNTISTNTAFIPVVSLELLSQIRTQLIPSSNLSLSTSYNQQLDSRLSLMLAYTGQFSNFKNGITTYFKRANSQAFDSLINRLSGNYEQQSSRSLTSGSIIYRYKKISITSRLQWLHHRIANSFNHSTINQQFTVSNFLLYGLFAWRDYGITLSQDVIIPPINATNPIINNENPFYIIKGNPSLLPEKRFNVYITGRLSSAVKNTRLSFYASMFFNRNSFIQATELTNSGVYQISYENVKSTSRLTGNISFGKQLFNRGEIDLAINTSLYSSYKKTPVKFNKIYANSVSYLFEPETSVNLNWRNMAEFNTAFSLQYEFINYDETSFSANSIVSRNLSGEIIIRPSKRLVWESSILFRNNGIIAANVPTTRTYWNMAVTAILQKNEAFLLKFSIYDLLNNNNNTDAYTLHNTVVNMQSNILTRYAMLTLTYNIRNNSGEKIGGKRKLFLF